MDANHQSMIEFGTMELSREDYDDLVRLHLCDWLEQVPRSKRPDYRRDSYQRMAKRLGRIAQEVVRSSRAPSSSEVVTNA